MCDIVDEQDNVLKQATREELRKNNLLHRGVAIFVFNSKGEIFVHQRTFHKDIYPGYFDMACGGGVQASESYEDAAKRELSEELGIKALPEFLFKVRYNTPVNNVIVKIFKTVYDGKIMLQKDEIIKGSFMKIGELNKLLKKEKFIPESIKTFKILNSKSPVTF